MAAITGNTGSVTGGVSAVLNTWSATISRAVSDVTGFGIGGHAIGSEADRARAEGFRHHRLQLFLVPGLRRPGEFGDIARAMPDLNAGDIRGDS